MINLLQKYGLDNFFISNLQDILDINKVAKIISCHKKGFKAINAQGLEINALVKGSDIHYKANTSSMLPKLGDFVVVDNNNNQDSNYFIKYILPRKNELKRKLAGEKQEDQIIATNIDFTFITNPMGDQFNIRKLERMVLACVDVGITPIIVITKCDLSQDIDEDTKALYARFSEINIIKTSFKDKDSINQIKEILKSNKIGAFIGSSGSGKSTLTNMILDKEVQKTLEVSKEKDKGKHTTTHREMFLLPSGGCIIDNPGIKEFGLWLSHEDSIEESFIDISNLAIMCKFRNCTHNDEPNCRIREAIECGEIDQERLFNYKKLKGEEIDVNLIKIKHERKQSSKSLSKRVKQAKNFKKSKYIDGSY